MSAVDFPSIERIIQSVLNLPLENHLKTVPHLTTADVDARIQELSGEQITPEDIQQLISLLQQTQDHLTLTDGGRSVTIDPGSIVFTDHGDEKFRIEVDDAIRLETPDLPLVLPITKYAGGATRPIDEMEDDHFITYGEFRRELDALNESSTALFTGYIVDLNSRVSALEAAVQNLT